MILNGRWLPPERITLQTKTKIIDLDARHLPFILENGNVLPQVSVAYESYGKPDTGHTNTILICHALTGDAHAGGTSQNTEDIFQRIPLLRAMKPDQAGWWDGMIGPGKTFDTGRFNIICTNILGSCYGTTGPVSLNPETGKKYGGDFPIITVRDMVRLQYLILRQLGIEQLALVTGGSLGGMQTLEWAIMYPDFIDKIIPVATSSRHSDWCVGINHLARQAIMNDPAWNNGKYSRQPLAGLSLARQIAMISYRADTIFNQRFQRRRLDNKNHTFDPKNIFQVESYLKYQGEKLINRFDANCYLRLSHAMDLHDVGLNRESAEAALAGIRAKTLCIGIDSDILYPAHEQRMIASKIPGAKYAEINSAYGHDAFLVEFEQMDKIITPFLNT
jgi:homoserine O-acetyltransferase